MLYPLISRRLGSEPGRFSPGGDRRCEPGGKWARGAGNPGRAPAAPLGNHPGAPGSPPDSQARRLRSPRAVGTSSFTPEDTAPAPPAGPAASALAGQLGLCFRIPNTWLPPARLVLVPAVLGRGQHRGAGNGVGGCSEGRRQMDGQPPSLPEKARGRRRGQEGVGGRRRCTGGRGRVQHLGAITLGLREAVAELEGAEEGNPAEAWGQVCLPGAHGAEVRCQAQRGWASSHPVWPRSLQGTGKPGRESKRRPTGAPSREEAAVAFHTPFPLLAIVVPPEKCLHHPLDTRSHPLPEQTRSLAPSSSPHSLLHSCPGPAFEARPIQPSPDSLLRVVPPPAGFLPAPCTEAWVNLHFPARCR